MRIGIGFKEPLKLGAPEWYLDLKVTGVGTIDNPFIISSPHNSNYNSDGTTFALRISDSKSYIELRKYSLRGITLVNCANFTISKCIIKRIKLIKFNFIETCIIYERILIV